MPESETLQDLFVDELKDAYDAEKQLMKALRKMARAATSPELATAFDDHLEETVGQVALLEEVFGLLDMKPRGKHCPGIAGIIEEGNEVMEEKDKSPLLDAALVGGGKRAEHYEIAAYTTLIAMATQLGMREAVGRLQQILKQEMATDAKLDALGERLLPLALGGASSESGDMEMERAAPKKAAAKKGGAKKAAAKKSAGKKSSGRSSR